jgi:hypothetical protein
MLRYKTLIYLIGIPYQWILSVSPGLPTEQLSVFLVLQFVRVSYRGLLRTVNSGIFEVCEQAVERVFERTVQSHLRISPSLVEASPN